MLQHVLPLASTLVSFAFAAAVFARYLRRGGPHLLAWGIGLTLYALGTFAEAWLFFQYDPFWLRLWYLCGAILTVGWLGHGTLFLLVRRRAVTAIATPLLLALSFFAISYLVRLPVTGVPYNLSQPVTAQYAYILVRDPVTGFLLAIFTFYGTTLLVGGALYSAAIFWRKRVFPQRVLGNVLIAAGGLLPALGGVMVKRGLGDFLFLSELLGATLMFAGFVLATRQQSVTHAAVAPAGASAARSLDAR